MNGSLALGNAEFRWKPHAVTGTVLTSTSGQVLLRNLSPWQDSLIKDSVIAMTELAFGSEKLPDWEFLAALAVILPQIQFANRTTEGD